MKKTIQYKGIARITYEWGWQEIMDMLREKVGIQYNQGKIEIAYDEADEPYRITIIVDEEQSEGTLPSKDSQA